MAIPPLPTNTTEYQIIRLSQRSPEPIDIEGPEDSLKLPSFHTDPQLRFVFPVFILRGYRMKWSKIIARVLIEYIDFEFSTKCKEDVDGI